MNREDFIMLRDNIVYLDNGATTLKPNVLSEITNEYYNKYSANAHRGDYDISLKVNDMYENTRKLIATMLNASNQEIIFTSGATDSLNKVIFGYFRKNLKSNDEVLITKSEHASNVLPWFELAEEIGVKVKYIPLDNEYKLTLENLKNSITSNTKVISIAHVTNVIGDVRPIREIIDYAHSRNILVLIDGAQSVPHMKINVKDLDIDFLVFSAHKMLGPTGVGVIYGKYNLLEQMKPIIFGGGMNASFDDDMNRVYNNIPYRFEAGTPNISGVIGFGKVIEYINNIGLDRINRHEKMLKEYLISKLKNNPNIIIYNANTESGIVTLNYKNIFAQDLAIYLNKYHICVRAGNHCAKILKNELGVKNTCRISFYLYNTKEDVDRLVEALNNPNIFNEII